MTLDDDKVIEEPISTDKSDANRPRTESTTIKGLAGVISKILRTGDEDKMDNGASGPVLAKRKALARKLEEENLKEKARKLARIQRIAARDSAHQTPTVNNLEKSLRKTATNGVVTLFNAVHQHQAAKEKIKKEAVIKSKSHTQLEPDTTNQLDRDNSLKSVSKASFLELLKMGGVRAAQHRESKSAPVSVEK